MKLSRRENRGVVILDLEGKVLGGEESEVLRREIDRAIRERTPALLLNLSGVPWLNSSGLGILLSGYLRLKEQGGEVKFMRAQERVSGILTTTKLLHVLEVFDDEEKAVGSFGGRGQEPVRSP
ncbi:MAG: anti-sigma factor antagonist [Candidatus Latescibacterota bacterium]|nr:MAG: anti-sigma factor antagonist [Candidatus Latescibacterota bacterium]